MTVLAGCFKPNGDESGAKRLTEQSNGDF